MRRKRHLQTQAFGKISRVIMLRCRARELPFAASASSNHRRPAALRTLPPFKIEDKVKPYEKGLTAWIKILMKN